MASKTNPVTERAKDLLAPYRLGTAPVFLLGTMDKNITVLSQQVRALNLAWALIEAAQVPISSGSSANRPRVAVVGAGFAGLTLTAGLIKKRVAADITLFERRDTVLPLQHGSDSRWLHPHIYDWPRRGSESFSAALPVMNWTASRASDVVVQSLAEWKRTLDELEQDAPGDRWTKPTLSIFCNTQHLQLSETAGRLNIEWIGEARDAANPGIPAAGERSAVGRSEEFDLVVLAVGFGAERDARTSYWRNETLAQPHLTHARRTYIVSGSGDGAMIDLFRLRIAHFRQDRILSEVFAGEPELLTNLREICADSTGRYLKFDSLTKELDRRKLKKDVERVLLALRERLRNDTEVLLHVRRPSFNELFDGKRVSFQNRLLVYLLYRCGGFTPVSGTEDDLDRLAREHSVPEERVVRRRGTDKELELTSLVHGTLKGQVTSAFASPERHRQSDEPAWSGGYFDMPRQLDPDRREKPIDDDKLKSHWRKEYLPSPMQAIATSFCAAIGGYLGASGPQERLRITLHRTLRTGDEVVLQQSCSYQGLVPSDDGDGAGRTFPSQNGTIGASFHHQRIIRSQIGATPSAIQRDMKQMGLEVAAQKMKRFVKSVAAIPLLATVGSDGTRTVLGVVYLDSSEKDFFTDGRMRVLVKMCGDFIDALGTLGRTNAERIANTEFWQAVDPKPMAVTPSPSTWTALELVSAPDPPTTDRLTHLNFDYSDFVPVETR